MTRLLTLPWRIATAFADATLGTAIVVIHARRLDRNREQYAAKRSAASG